ncbi:PREDICTED: ganglioside-induced differentiation-associated protein 2 [Propithecus coquereli]|uniref:ganglioside-induced differentiation-associated protein 2 n=1 Tax=Propithecus coquereli TaxID=379532 RepID=UPI00063F74BF|nr:PREDICTED: ganglioside-induced differentiation-associated protein 2 [Propithecus coquereli]
MDPLGAPSQFVDVDTLTNWGDSCEDELNSSDTTAEIFQEDTIRSPFLYNKDVNGKVVLCVSICQECLTYGCRTGEAKLTKGFNLAARFIIHTVGPKYKSRYRTAAESSLYSCYRNVLQLAKYGLLIYRQCPAFLTQATYQKLLPLYFPRSLKEESRSLPYLPADIGNAEGEPVVPERQIRISEKPGAPEDNQEEEDDGLGVDLSFIGSHAFARMEGDIDKQRKLILQGQLSEAALQKQHQRNYNRWLCQARSEDLSDIASLKALYQTGELKGMAILYFIHVMDHIAVKEYVLVYFHTLTSEYNHLDSDFLKKLYDVVDVKLVSTWFFTTFSVSGLKDKIHHVDSLHQLFSAISPEQIDFPPFVLEYDARENGPYYTPYPPSPDL